MKVWAQGKGFVCLEKTLGWLVGQWRNKMFKKWQRSLCREAQRQLPLFGQRDCVIGLFVTVRGWLVFSL